MNDTAQEYNCEICGAKCCKYVALEIDEPTDHKDYDNIRWYLRHKDVHVFVDHDGSWCIEFRAVCESLDDGNRCVDYEDRPSICRKHGDVDECDLYHDEKSPYVLNFESCREFEAWLDDQGHNWR